MRTNKDGTYHLGDLRRWVLQSDKYSAYCNGFNWTVYAWDEDLQANRVYLFTSDDERNALAFAYHRCNDESFNYHQWRVQWKRELLGKGS